MDHRPSPLAGTHSPVGARSARRVPECGGAVPPPRSGLLAACMAYGRPGKPPGPQPPSWGIDGYRLGRVEISVARGPCQPGAGCTTPPFVPRWTSPGS